MYEVYRVNVPRYQGLTSHIGKTQTWNRVFGCGVQVISMQGFMSGEHAKVYGAQHIQPLGSHKPIRQTRHYSPIVLYVIPIRRLLFYVLTTSEDQLLGNRRISMNLMDLMRLMDFAEVE